MFFAKYEIDGKESTGLYWDYCAFHKDTFSPTYKQITFIIFEVYGKNYQSRKASLHDLAVGWSNADTAGISYSELAEVENWFYKHGKRYGLLEEFRENAII